jgi:hypothetical protein
LCTSCSELAPYNPVIEHACGPKFCTHVYVHQNQMFYNNPDQLDYILEWDVLELDIIKLFCILDRGWNCSLQVQNKLKWLGEY